MRPPLTLAASEGAQGIFLKNTFLKSEFSDDKDEACHSYVVKIFIKPLLIRGVRYNTYLPACYGVEVRTKDVGNSIMFIVETIAAYLSTIYVRMTF